MKYTVLADNLRKEILSGSLKYGERLKTECELANLYGISRQTVRHSLDLLEQDGFIYKKRGSGSYVNYIREDHKPHTQRIGVIVTYIGDYIFPAMLRGIDSVLTEHSYSMVLKATQNRIDNERAILQTFLQDPVDGLIIEGTKTALPNPNLGLYEELIKQKVPMVFMNSYDPQLENPHYVVMNDREGSLHAIQYLVQHGHREIVGIFKSDDIQGIGRYTGFINGLSQNNLPISDERLIWYNTESKTLILDELCDKLSSPACAGATAYVCYNDEIARRTVEALHLIGSDTSDKVVVSFDENVYFEHFSGKIVTLKHPKEIMGHKAATMLIDIINGGTNQSVTLPWEFEI